MSKIQEIRELIADCDDITAINAFHQILDILEEREARNSQWCEQATAMARVKAMGKIMSSHDESEALAWIINNLLTEPQLSVIYPPVGVAIRYLPVVRKGNG